MRKEIVAAVIAGGLLGLVIAFGVWRANIALTPPKEEDIKQEEIVPTQQVDLVIASPESGVVLSSSPTLVRGLTKPGNFVAITGEEDDAIVVADASGQFAGEIKLISGLNQISVFSFDAADGQKSEFVQVVYSTQFAQGSDEAASQESAATDEADAIREKVQQKVSEAANKPIFYMGPVTDITETAIQIKNGDGEIKQISVDDETTFVKVTTETKTATFEDTAIGDFIIAMGYTNGNGVLAARRIIITTEPGKTARTAIIGKVTEIAGKKVTVTAGEASWTLEFGKSWEGPEISELEEGMQIIATGEAENSTLTIRTLFIVPQEE